MSAARMGNWTCETDHLRPMTTVDTDGEHYCVQAETGSVSTEEQSPKLHKLKAKKKTQTRARLTSGPTRIDNWDVLVWQLHSEISELSGLSNPYRDDNGTWQIAGPLVQQVTARTTLN